jgi:ParB family transcriptional regulator, chromosome partitioning protein
LKKSLSSSNLIAGLIEDVDIYKIKRPPEYYYSRSSNIDELANSIKLKGLLQPIVVRTKPEGYFEIVAGNRRLEACKTLGWRKIVCHIIELDDKQAFEISLMENIQRKTLSPIEEAYAFRSYVKDLGRGGISDLAAKIGKSVSYVDKRIKLLELPPEVIESVSNSMISASVAEELCFIADSKRQQEFAKIAACGKMSSRQTRNLIKEFKEECLDYNSSQSVATMAEMYERGQRSLDKSITALKIAMNKIASIIEQVEEDWIIYEILMQHKSMLNSQIDILIKEKKKLR